MCTQVPTQRHKTNKLFQKYIKARSRTLFFLEEGEGVAWVLCFLCVCACFQKKILRLGKNKKQNKTKTTWRGTNTRPAFLFWETKF